MIAAIIGVVLIAGGIGVWYMLSARSNIKKGGGEIPTPTATATATVTATVSPNPSASVTPPVVIKTELIQIPGGAMEMGRDDGAQVEGPKHLVPVRPFAIDKTEVTNGEYAQFVSETHHQPPSNWPGDKPYQGDEMRPVVNVSFQDAVEFAKWRSKRDGVTYRLPTEEEWEYAARGGDSTRVFPWGADQGNLYPWGNTWEAGRAVTNYAAGNNPAPVGSHPGDRTRWGVMDMEGNVREWTLSKASLYKGNPGQVDPATRDWIIIRGASFATVEERKLPLTFRDWFDPRVIKQPTIGFRLVRAG